MSITGGPDIVENGLVLYLDAANRRSYAGSGTAWNDLSGNNNNLFVPSGTTYNSLYGGELATGTVVTSSVTPTTTTTGTVAFWTRTTDVQGVYFTTHPTTSTAYIAAYNNGTYYQSNSGSPSYTININASNNPMNYLNNIYFYWEAKNVNFTNWVGFRVASYGGCIHVYRIYVNDNGIR